MITLYNTIINDVLNIDIQEQQIHERKNVLKTLNIFDWKTVKDSNGIILFIFSFVKLSDSNVMLCAIVSKQAYLNIISSIKTIVRLIRVYNTIFPRITCTVKTDFKQGHRLMRIINFKKECDMPYYFNNMTYTQYSLIRR